MDNVLFFTLSQLKLYILNRKSDVSSLLSAEVYSVEKAEGAWDILDKIIVDLDVRLSNLSTTSGEKSGKTKKN